jgi:hypothetical protein
MTMTVTQINTVYPKEQLGEINEEIHVKPLAK